VAQMVQLEAAVLWKPEQDRIYPALSVMLNKVLEP